MVVAVVVHHDDGRIDDQSERHGNAGQRERMQAHVEHIIGHHGHQDIGSQRNGDDGQILPAPPHQPDKSQQDGQRHERAGDQCLQFRLLFLGGIIGKGQIQAVTQSGFQLLYLLPDLPGEFNLVGIGIHDDIHVDGVQAVHPEITAGQPVLVFKRGQVVQVDDFPVHRFQRHFPDLARKARCFQVQGDTAFLPVGVGIHHVPHDVGLADKAPDAVGHVRHGQPVIGYDQRIVSDLQIFGHLPRPAPPAPRSFPYTP